MPSIMMANTIGAHLTAMPGSKLQVFSPHALRHPLLKVDQCLTTAALAAWVWQATLKGHKKAAWRWCRHDRYLWRCGHPGPTGEVHVAKFDASAVRDALAGALHWRYALASPAGTLLQQPPSVRRPAVSNPPPITSRLLELANPTRNRC